MVDVSAEAEIPNWLRSYFEIEDGANKACAHSPYLIYGLLQTPEYAAAIARSVGVIQPDDEYIERTVRLRNARQRRVHSGELKVIAIQPEFSLRLRVGSNAVMAAQIAQLAELSERPNVTVQVMPYSVGQYEALRIGSFTLLSSSDQQAPVAHIEGHDGVRMIDDATHFLDAFTQARKLALCPVDSRKFIADVEQQWSGQ